MSILNFFRKRKPLVPTKLTSGETVPKSGLYVLKDHNKDCDKAFVMEYSQWLVKGERAPKIFICQHDAVWELVRKI